MSSKATIITDVTANIQIIIGKINDKLMDIDEAKSNNYVVTNMEDKDSIVGFYSIREENGNLKCEMNKTIIYAFEDESLAKEVASAVSFKNGKGHIKFNVVSEKEYYTKMRDMRLALLDGLDEINKYK